MMTVLDGRDSHKVPTVTKIDNYEIIETLKTNEDVTVLCLMIDDHYVPCVENKDYNWILCAAYKRRNGFNKWFNRQCR